jgi:hypothetical protein
MASPGLINLQTDLKSLRYGSDKPYITKDVNDPPSSNQTGMQITKRIDDLSRIAQLLIDRPGLKFIGNQALLQQVDIQDKLQKSRDKGKTFAGALLQQGLSTVKQTAKILGSTIAQVPVNGTGTHFVYAFRTDTYLQPSGGNNRSAFAQFFGAGGVEGAPLALRGKNITGKVESNFGEPNQQTGEFKIISESELDYDEKINSLIPGRSAYNNAKEGTPIIEDNTGQEGWKPYTSTGVKEQFVDRDTNKIVSQSIFADKQIQNKSRSIITGSVRNSSIEIISPLTGDPLTIPQKETTATAGTLGVSNQGVVGDISETSTENIGKQYTSKDTYTGIDSAETIRRSASGKNISMKLSGAENDYLPNPSVTDNTFGDVEVGNIINESTGEVVEGISTGELLIPKKTTLKNLQRAISTGSADVVSRSGEFLSLGTPIVKDFRTGKSYSFDYTSPTINREQRVNLGNQGRSVIDFGRAKYSDTDPLAIDTLNALDIQSSEQAAGNKEGRDFAKFYFEIITPDKSQFLHFRAFIDSIDDSYNADWQGFKYVGRADSFYTYGGFERDINISFKIAAATRSEMKPLYRKMVLLASSTAPTYGGQGFMRGTLAKLTVGSYFTQLPGVITSVKYSLIQDMPWELSMQSPEQGGDSDVQELPMGLQCSISYKVIHNFAPQTGLYHYFTNPNPVNAQDFLK